MHPGVLLLTQLAIYIAIDRRLDVKVKCEVHLSNRSTLQGKEREIGRLV
jgi:hypothetical protein